jgi:AcrR family transcriptional regulator
MSGKAATSSKKMDRRVRRTRDALGDAMVELIQEKPFDAITVQEVLDRAGVSRSTFYTHFRDKNDLFISDVDEFLQAMSTLLIRLKEPSERVAPVREFFAHVAEMGRLHAALAISARLHDFLDLAQGHFARAIEQRLATLPQASGIPADQRVAVASALAGSLLALLSWWLRRGTPGSALEMDELFHRMVWSGVGSDAGDHPRKSTRAKQARQHGTPATRLAR